MVWGLFFTKSKVLAVNGVLFGWALDGLPILTGGQNVPPKGGILYAFHGGGGGTFL